MRLATYSTDTALIMEAGSSALARLRESIPKSELLLVSIEGSS